MTGVDAAPVTVSPEALDAPDSRRLVADQLREMQERYADDGPAPLRPEQVTPPHGTFLVARRAGEAVGCGALRTLEPGVGEVKRMYVVPHARRQGVGGVVLAALVAAGHELGMRRLLLETGTLQPEAVALYVRDGWQPVASYGEFRDDPRSLCFALDLVPGAGA